MIVELEVVTRLQDNGDGGYTMYVYANEEDLIRNHPRCSEMKVVDGRLVTEFTGCSDELREEILDGYDEYENGYLGTDKIKIEVMADGSLRLAEPLSFHGGQ